MIFIENLDFYLQEGFICHSQQQESFAPAMKLILIPFLVAIASVLALLVLKMDLDPQTAVEGKLEVREPQVSWWFQVVII